MKTFTNCTSTGTVSYSGIIINVVAGGYSQFKCGNPRFSINLNFKYSFNFIVHFQRKIPSHKDKYKHSLFNSFVWHRKNASVLNERKVSSLL